MYEKGASSERELAKILYEKGFVCCRAAGSGRGLPGPDIIAFKDSKLFAIECKAHQKRPKFDWSQLEDWKKNGAVILLAWKVPYKGWKFYDDNEKPFKLL